MLSPVTAMTFVVAFFAASTAADQGDDFANNLFSDLAPLLALFGERVTTQFMSQAMGWADNIILAMAPLGVLTIIVSAIRVGGPIWLRAMIGRARENRAAVEEELMSSTSNEVCELWNGQKVVRLSGEAPIAEFICLLPPANGTTNEPTRDDGGTSGQSTTEVFTTTSPKPNHIPSSPSPAPGMCLGPHDRDQDFFEVVSLAGAIEKNYLQEADQDVPGSTRVASSLLSFWRRCKKPVRDTEKSTRPLDGPNTKKLIIVRNKEDAAAPNLLLNIDRFSKKGELWTVALIGTVLQIAVLLYSGFITYYPTLMFKKGGLPITHYAYPCTAVGTALLVSGLLICSHVVESSTHESMYRPNGFEARMLYLQKAGTVDDQSFGSFAIFSKDAKSVITTSRRELGESIGSVLEIKTILGTLVSLSGFVIQFVGLRSMHWSATIAQLVATVAMTALRAFVRRDLANITATQNLSPGFELDWFATKLALKFSPGRLKGQSKPVQATRSPSDWLDCPMDNHMSKGCGARNDESTADEGRKWIINVIPSEILNSGNLKASTANNAMRLRKGLADLAPWPRPRSTESKAVAAAIEITLNFFDAMSAFSLAAKDINSDSTRDSGNDGDLNSLVWHVESRHEGKIHFSAHRESGRWRVSEAEIEATLSLWNYGVHVQHPGQEPAQTTGSDDASSPNVDLASSRVLRLLGSNSARLRRDLRWWLPNETAKIIAVSSIRPANGGGILDGECRGIIGYGPNNCPDAWSETLQYRAMELQRPYDTACQFESPHLYLATVSEKPAKLLFAQHLFTAFMWALSEKLLRPIKGRATVQASDLSQLDSSASWQLFTLQNVHLSRMAQDIHASGLGSLEEIYLCIIPPLSLTHRLPQAYSVVDWANQRFVHPGLTGRWTEAVEAFIWLLGTFPVGDPVQTHAVPAAVSLLLLLAQESKTRELQKYQETRIKQLKGLIKELVTKLKATNIANNSLALYAVHGPSWTSEAAKTIQPQLPPPMELTYPNPIKIVAEEIRADDMVEEWTKSANLNITDAQGRTTLHYASMKKHFTWFNRLLDKGDKINVQDRLGWTPLHFASGHGNASTVIDLIQAGADIGIRTQEGMTALHCAARANSIDVVKQLVTAGADVNGLDGLSNTALHWAAFNGDHDVIKYLLPVTNPNLRTIGGRTVLHQAALGGRCMDLPLEYMVENGYDPGAKDRDGRTALHHAAWSGYTTIVLFLVNPFRQSYILLQEVDGQGMWPIDLAVSGGSKEIVKDLLLFDKIISVEHKDVRGATTLHHAAAGNCDTLLQDWISKFHMDPSQPDKLERAGIHYAAMSGSKAAIEVLTANGANVWAADRDGLTALHLTAEYGHQDCVEYLTGQLPANKEGWPVTSSGQTPLHRAALNCQAAVVGSLLEKGCPIEQEDDDGCTALHRAAEGGDIATVKFLLEWAPQEMVNARTHFGNEPLAYASYQGHFEIVELLYQKGANVRNQNDQGKTPFLIAAECALDFGGDFRRPGSIEMTTMERRVEILQFLVQMGADPNAVDSKGRNAHELLFSGGNFWRQDEDGQRRRPLAMYLEALSVMGPH